MLSAVDTLEIKSVVTDWISHIITSRRWSATQLARKANLSPSTILRIINDPNHKFAPSLRTLQSISEASGYPIPKSLLNVMSEEREREEPASEVVEVPDERDVVAAEFHGSTMVKVEHVSALPKSLRRFVDDRRDIEIPATLSVDPTTFAFYAPDNRLAPMVRAGYVLFASRRREPHEGDMILVRQNDGRSFVSFLMVRDEKGIKISEDMIEASMEIDFDGIDDIAVIEGIRTAA